jgi:hypothetical protein
MVLNLSKFARTSEAIVPFWDGWGQVNGRKLYMPQAEDGWWLVALGAGYTLVRKATPLEIFRALRGKNMLRVYALGTDGVPLNFDNFFKRGLTETAPIFGINLGPFSIAKAIVWEDGRLYYQEQDARVSPTLRAIKEAFDTDQPITNIKHITPEMRYYFLILSLQRAGMRQAEELEKMKLSQLEKEKRIREFQNTFSGRLQTIIEHAGGTLIKFFKANADTWMVHWKVNNQLVKSTIHDDMRIISAGFCLSGEDTKHTMGSIINLAKMFQDRSPLYITRE